MREPERPDPDRLLDSSSDEERRSGRGKLKIFFGYVAGVGKTYAMLEAAQQPAAAGVDVVVGYVEPHDRPETDALLEGLEVLPVLEIDYRGVNAARVRPRRRPRPPSRTHPGRRAGPHQRARAAPRQALAGRRGAAGGRDQRVHHAQRPASGEPQRRHRADHRGPGAARRCRTRSSTRRTPSRSSTSPPASSWSGSARARCTCPRRPARAMESFFKGPNLGALREIALRRTADRTHVHLETARLGSRGRQQIWAISETLLVCIGPSPTSAKVIRVSKRMAASLNARWIAASVETTGPGA